MNREHTLPINELTPRSIISELRCRGWTLKTGSAAFGFCGGVFAGACGSLLTAVAWFTGAVWHGHSVQRFGTILLFLTIPLLVLGAHCLDLLETHEERKQR
ncbi:MAG TPA: hypothetical protein VJ749_03665 [Pyrinomonadaceae bacterium]|jgi:hypothetical protein|nr:hypothetical protein [Pyrinomonadaceae bacterium]